MRYRNLILAITTATLLTGHAQADMDVIDNRPIKVNWENFHPIDSYSQRDNKLPKVIKTAFYYSYGYYYTPPGSRYPVYVPYTRPIRTYTGTHYVPTAVIRYAR